MFKLTILGSILVVCMASSAFAYNDPVVYFLVGESNMCGRGLRTGLPEAYAGQPERVRFFTTCYGSFYSFKEQRTVGPEISFSYSLASAWPSRDIWIVKAGGDGNKKRGMLNWIGGGSLLKNFSFAVKNAKWPAEATVGGLFFYAGGADTRSEAGAEAFRDRLQAFISSARTLLNKPNLPIYVVRLNNSVGLGPYLPQIREAQEWVANNVPNVRLISSDGINGYMRDGVHLNTAGQIIFGQRLAEAVLAGGTVN